MVKKGFTDVSGELMCTTCEVERIVSVDWRECFVKEAAYMFGNLIFWGDATYTKWTYPDIPILCKTCRTNLLPPSIPSTDTNWYFMFFTHMAHHISDALLVTYLGSQSVELSEMPSKKELLFKFYLTVLHNLDPGGGWRIFLVNNQALRSNLLESEMTESTSVAGPGFVNMVLPSKSIAKSIRKMLGKGIELWAPRLKINRVVVDFSSPDIAKEMNVRHLTSTIIGDTLARMFEFSNVTVLRRNHVGDWGTQFGMLIEFLFENFPEWEEADEQPIGDLQEFYKASKMKFDGDPLFKEKAQHGFVRLQGGEAKYLKAWAQICDISRKEFKMLYERLGVVLEEKGESFYNPYIPGVLKTLSNQGLVEERQGAKVIVIEGQEIPLIVVKSDGGYNYASTDLTALWYRLNEEKAEWIIYVTDVCQAQHFDMVFSAAKRAGWLQDNDNMYPKTSHVGFRTRSSEVVRLVDLLDKAKSQSVDALVKCGKAAEWTPEELEQTAKAVAYGAVKYADLKNNRLTNYTFDFDQMFSDKGNTAVYLLYAHVRICSIIRESGKNIEELKRTGDIVLDHVDERVLGIHLHRFAEIVESACTNLLPDLLCEYLYNLSENFTKFYFNCQVNGSTEETSSLLLCEATAIVMRKCFQLLGIEPVY